MSDSFKRILRTKSAEQLTNMCRNQSHWSEEEYILIKEEVKNRGLGIFEEPEEWSDEVMQEVDLLNPKTRFEQDMAYLVKEKEEFESNKGLILSAQIISIASVFIGFSFLYWYMKTVITFGFSSTFKFNMLSIGVAISGLLLYVIKKYLASIIVSAISLLITLVILILSLQKFM